MSRPAEACVIVNDASCLIDVRKGGLLAAMMALPYRFVVPLPVRESELLDFTAEDWRRLDAAGMETFDLPPDRVAEAFAVKAAYPKLSANDCFCLVTTQCHADAVLLTGDGLLRKVAAGTGLPVHGVLWLADRLRAERTCAAELLIAALEIWKADRAVFLPEAEIDRLLHLLRRP